MTWNPNVHYCRIDLADVCSARELDGLLDAFADHIDSQLRLNLDGDLWGALWHLDAIDAPEQLTPSLPRMLPSTILTTLSMGLMELALSLSAMEMRRHPATNGGLSW